MSFGLPMIAAVILVGCGGSLSAAPPSAAPQPSPRSGQPSQGLRVHVANDVAIVAQGDTDARLAERLKTAVEVELGRRGLRPLPGNEKAADLTIRIETRVKGIVYFLRGHIGLTAERGSVAIATAVTGDEIHRENEFPGVMAEKAVNALLGSPAFVEFAERRAARRVAPPTRPQTVVVAQRPSPEMEAKTHYSRGTSFYNLGRYREALAQYEAAYLAVQDPPFLFNIAQCQRKMGKDSEAVATYRTYLRVAPNAPNRLEVQRKIAELEKESHAAALNR